MDDGARADYYYRCAEHYAEALRKIKMVTIAAHPAWYIASQALTTAPKEVVATQNGLEYDRTKAR